MVGECTMIVADEKQCRTMFPTMRQWGMRPVPDEERLDPSRYPEEFVEF